MQNYSINGKDFAVEIIAIEGDRATVSVNGVEYNVTLPAAQAAAPRATAPTPAAAVPAPAAAAPAAAAGGAATVAAPLPGTVLNIKCKVGDTVKASDTVVILEAMKMENAIPAGRDGRVVSINVKQGDSVLEGDTLVTLA